MSRCEMTAAEARAIINRVIEDHQYCDRSCDARGALEADLPFYAAYYLDGAGADDSGDLARALERLDPGGAKRESEWSAFAKLPYVVCKSCETTYYGEQPIDCCGMRQHFVPPTRAATAPHARCERAGRCVEHAQNRRVQACR